jgi:hypothetical protein
MNAANQSYKHEGPKVLLVEGKDDCHVIWALCAAHQVPEIFGIYVCESDEMLLSRLNALIQQPEMTTVGVVIDADTELSERWQSIQGKLQHYPYVLSDIPEPLGTIVESIEDKPRLGFWLMPNNVDPGMLEDFCRQLAPSDAIVFADQCVAEAKTKGFATFRDVHQSKAVVHTYLAWQDEPGKPLGQAITAQALKPETEIARTFTDWLQRLFGNA